MYGMVNKAIQDLVTKNFSEEQWIVIKEKVGFEDDFFISMQPYPDQLTYDLVAAASEVLKLEQAAILEAFGEHWILYTAVEGYGEMLALSGSTLPEFLGNLNLLHDRIANIMPELEPPKFTTKEIKENHVELIYESDRGGLASMVVGMLRGLGKRFEKNCKITQISHKSETEKDVFSVSW